VSEIIAASFLLCEEFVDLFRQLLAEHQQGAFGRLVENALRVPLDHFDNLSVCYFLLGQPVVVAFD
jgi:hypothetical protein